MAPYQVSSTVAATPATIWETCFADMKWETWDPDVRECKDASGPCENGTTAVLAMENGTDFPILLSEVVLGKSLTFSGALLGGMMGCKGVVGITPVTAETSQVDYSFEMTGCIGALFSKSSAGNKAVVGGVEGGIANIQKLSEEAQKAK